MGLVEAFVGVDDAPDSRQGKLCLTWMHSFRVLGCGPVQVHTIRIGTA